MSRQTFLPYAAGLALAVTLTGCAAESAAPEPMTPVPTVSAPSSSVATSAPAAPAASPTSAAPDFPEGLPAAAKKHTNEGARVFIAHVIDQVNAAWTAPDSTALDGLCDESAGACSFWVDEAQKLVREGQRYEGDPVSLTKLDPISPTAGKTRFITHIVQERRDIVDARGVRVKTDPHIEAVFISTVSWTSTGWTLFGFDVVSG